jgi:hypothetical protein
LTATGAVLGSGYPLADISVLEHVDHVMKGGKVVR